MQAAKNSYENRIGLLQHPDRPNTIDILHGIFPDFMEFHGDRIFGDDPAVIGGIAWLNKQPVTVIGQVRGKTIEDNIKYNFSMCHPEGFRKSMRLIKQAEKFNRPVIFLVDTLGAYPGEEAEERGQSSAIANSLMELQELRVPVISIIIGNAGSGGALAFMVANEIAMMENAVFSVISPKGCAEILWKDSSKQEQAAQMLKITAKEIKALKLIDTVLKEPGEGAHTDQTAMIADIKGYLVRVLKRYKGVTAKKIIKLRQMKYRKIGRE